MPTNHTGSAAGLTDADPIVVSNPNDGEDLTAASNATAPSKLADFLTLAKTLFGRLAAANTWALAQIFSGAVTVAGTLTANGQTDINGNVSLATNKTMTLFGDSKISSQSNPAANTGVTNQLHAKNMPKAWALVEITAGPAITLKAGFNIAGVSASGNAVQIDFADDLANNDFGADVTDMNFQAAGTNPIIHGVSTKTTSAVYISATQWASGAWATINLPTSTGRLFSVHVFGEQ